MTTALTDLETPSMTLPTLRTLATLACLSLALPATAQTPPPPPEGGPQQGGPPGAHGPRGGSRELNVFFSPAGQPFRADAGAPYPLKLWFEAADANHDGRLDAVEFLSDAQRFFKVVDTDHNEVISSPENSRYEDSIAPEILRFDQRLGGPGARRKPAQNDDPSAPKGTTGYIKVIQGAGQYSLISEPQPIRACDSNLDFKVTLKEWQEANRQRFVLLDRNKDGALTLDELPQTPAAAAIEAMAQNADKPGKPPKGRKLW